MRSSLRLLFWLTALFAFVMAVLPHPPLLVPVWDKLQHFGAFASLMAVAMLAYPRVRSIKLALALCSFGALIELVQGLPMVHRDADVHDWVADLLAIFVVLVLAQLWKPMRASALFLALAVSRLRRDNGRAKGQGQS